MAKDWLDEDPAFGLHQQIPDGEQERLKFLFDGDRWNDRVKSFEAAMEHLNDEKKQKKRSEYVIDFSDMNFSNIIPPSKYNFPSLPNKIEKNFSKYTFPCTVNFSNASFEDGITLFDGAVFLGNVNFEGAFFGNGYVSFQDAIIEKGDLNFCHTNFGEGDVILRVKKFGEGEFNLFDSSVRKGDLLFGFEEFNAILFEATKMNIEGCLHVKGRFPCEARFKEIKIGETATFADAKFKTVPDFRDTSFGRPPEVSGMEVPRPTLERLKNDKNNPIRKIHLRYFKCTKDKGDAEKYRKLKSMALAAYDHEKDGEFFSYEMMAKRGWETKTFWGLTFNSFYYLLSDYGQSLTRPVVGMFSSFIIFVWGYFSLISLSNEWWIEIGTASIGFLLSLCLFGFWLSDYDFEKKFTQRIKWILAGFLIYTTSYIVFFGGYLCKWNEIYFAIRLSYNNFLPVIGTFNRLSIKPQDNDSLISQEYRSSFLQQFDLFFNDGLYPGFIIRLEVLQNAFGAILLFLFLLAIRNKFRLK